MKIKRSAIPRLMLAVGLVVLIVLVLFVCCNTGMNTAAAMKRSLDAEIPAGTSVHEASDRLKARGFTVTSEVDSSWGGRRNLDYLYGDMREGIIFQRRWQIGAFHKAGTVTGIEVTTGLVGP